MRVLHVLHHSVPYLDGYCVRSKEIVDFQRSIGIDVQVLTSAQHEVEVERPEGTEAEPETIGAVRYNRTPLPAGPFPRFCRRVPFAREVSMMSALSRSLRRLLRREAVDVIHAHSPVLCGLPAVLAATTKRIPCVYEVRGFWEDGFVGRWSAGDRAIRYKLSRYLETLVFRQATAVVAISQHMADDIAARGIPTHKLHRVPNGVDASRFLPTKPDESLMERYGLRARPIVGFIGSFYALEGLECLLDAMVHVRHRVPEARLLLVGGGEQEEMLPRRVEELGLLESVVIAGRVPHEEITRYYSVMDLLVYPRLRNRTTELTTPLKPLEAMAMGKAILGSDVGGIRELLSGGRVGSLFEAGNSEHLADQIVRLLTTPDLRERLGREGREYVLRERAWDQLVLQYREIYRALAKAPLRVPDAPSAGSWG